MAEIAELTYEAHSDLKVDTLAAIEIAKKTHIMTLRVTEISRAACELPVFFTKSNKEDGWLISAITSLEVEKNLFVRDSKWQAMYQPSAMAVYPFQLIRHPSQEQQFTVGIDTDNTAFSTDTGEALFESEKKAGPALSRATQILQADIRNDVFTYQFSKHIGELGLIVPIDIGVVYETNRVNTLKGLHTVDEAKLAELSEEQFKELREKNYLAPLYSMLLSLFQLNHLIRLHNEHSGTERIKQVQMGAEKAADEAQATEASS